MKRAIIRRIYIWANATLTPLIGAAVLAGYHKLPAEMQALVDPYAATTVAVGLVAGLLSFALAKWQKIPVEELQAALAEKGLYAGRIDGDLGEKTRVAIARAVDDPAISTDGTGDLIPTTVKARRPAPHSKSNPLGL